MNIKINIGSKNVADYCNITIIDTSDSFLNEYDRPQFNNYTESEVSAINVLQFNDPENLETPKIIDQSISDLHTEVTFDVKKDGWYTLHHILLPNVTWFDKIKNTPIAHLGSIYYIDGNKVMKYNKGLFTEINNFLELIEINTVNTTITRLRQDYFSIHYLMKCYIKHAKELLGFYFKCENLFPKDLIFKRDYLWMLINVIKYSVELGDWEGAVARLYKFNYCNGLCDDIDVKLDNSGCGC